jgi:hypothetical protein
VKDCLERPRKKSAKWTNQAIAADDLIQSVGLERTLSEAIAAGTNQPAARTSNQPFQVMLNSGPQLNELL